MLGGSISRAYRKLLLEKACSPIEVQPSHIYKFSALQELKARSPMLAAPSISIEIPIRFWALSAKKSAIFDPLQAVIIKSPFLRSAVLNASVAFSTVHSIKLTVPQEAE